MNNDKVPRRIRVELYKPAETAIHNAIKEVEKTGADLRLTEAIMCLVKAKDYVSDYIDGIRPLLNSATEKVSFDKWKEDNSFWQDKDVDGIVGDYLWRSPKRLGAYTDNDLHREFLKDFFKVKPDKILVVSDNNIGKTFEDNGDLYYIDTEFPNMKLRMNGIKEFVEDFFEHSLTKEKLDELLKGIGYWGMHQVSNAARDKEHGEKVDMNEYEDMDRDALFVELEECKRGSKKWCKKAMETALKLRLLQEQTSQSKSALPAEEQESDFDIAWKLSASTDKPFFIDTLRKLLNQYYKEEISLSKVAEELNVTAYKWAKQHFQLIKK